MSKRGSSVRGQSGFSLIEVLLVLALIAAIGSLVATNVFKQGESAKVKLAIGGAKKLGMAVDNFYIDTGNLPSKLEDLIRSPGNTPGWDGPYVKDGELNDPWDSPYQFKSPGDNGPYDILSYGADKKPGGDGKGADIGNWMG